MDFLTSFPGSADELVDAGTDRSAVKLGLKAVSVVPFQMLQLLMYDGPISRAVLFDHLQCTRRHTQSAFHGHQLINRHLPSKRPPLVTWVARKCAGAVDRTSVKGITAFARL